MSQRTRAAVWLTVIVAAVSCRGREPAQRTVTGGGSKAFLEVTGPEFTTANASFDLAVTVKASGAERLPFSIAAEGCEVRLIGSTPPVRLSSLRPDLKGVLVDPYVPPEEFIAPDAGGEYRTPVRVATGPYESAVPKIGAKGRACILEVRCGAYANATFRVEVEE